MGEVKEMEVSLDKGKDVKGRKTWLKVQPGNVTTLKEGSVILSYLG